MKKMLSILLTGMLMLCFAACTPENTLSSNEKGSSVLEYGISVTQNDISTVENATYDEESVTSGTERSSSVPENNDSLDDSGIAVDDGSKDQSEEIEGESAMGQDTFYVTVGDEIFTATFSDNLGAQALKELLAEGPVTIQMSDYAGFEKVGSLNQSLPASNTQMTTQPGDIVLYQENQIVIFYGSNSWSYTRLGKIDDITGWEEALGSGDVSVTFSLTDPQY